MSTCDCCNKAFKNDKAVAGHKGAIKARIARKANYLERVRQYDSNPSYCIVCEKVLSYKAREQTYCSSSCSAHHTNQKRGTRKSYTKCATETCSNQTITKYCSQACSVKGHWLATVLPRIQAGLVKNRTTLRRYLVTVHGKQCAVCGLAEWLGGEMPVELDHVDGDPSNNDLPNLRLICPNCHAKTPTYKAKNKGKGRKSRGLKPC